MEDIDPTPAPGEARAAALAYALGFLTGIFCLWAYGDRPFVRFHAWQSILLWVAFGTAIVGLDFIPIVGAGVALLALMVGVALSVLLLWRAWRGDWLALPLIGDIARERAVEDD
jgi:uncharacterized membrane protein